MVSSADPVDEHPLHPSQLAAGAVVALPVVESEVCVFTRGVPIHLYQKRTISVLDLICCFTKPMCSFVFTTYV